MEFRSTTAVQGALTLQDFDFDFPEDLVAHAPLANRDESRLLVRHQNGDMAHRLVPDLVRECAPGTVLVFNDSRVFPSRLEGHLPSGGRIELFLIREEGGDIWSALGRPMKKLTPGRTVLLGKGLEATVLGRQGDLVQVKFNVSPQELTRWLDHNGFIPLPPYIKRQDPQPAALSSDRDRYQTVYARERGSVAAPTAGLHFTEPLLAQLRERGVEVHYLSLHVGAGTFLPVKQEDVSQHAMHQELYRVPRETARAVWRAKAEGRKVIAVGTTTFRSLEDLYRRASGDQGCFEELAETWHSTGIFIFPKTAMETYRPWVIDGIVTNFHQPKSTLFMLISALLGLEQAKTLYREAFLKGYRLFSYGDTSLLWL